MKKTSFRGFGTDYSVLVAAALATALSSLALYSLGSFVIFDQSVYIVHLIIAVVGIILAIAVSQINYMFFVQNIYVVVAFMLAPVFLTFIIGLSPNGSGTTAWLPMPFGFTFQPSELAKIALILSFSVHLEKVKRNIDHPVNVALLLAHISFYTLIVILQKDDGSAIIFLAIGLVMLFSAGVSLYYFLGLAATFAILSPFIWQELLSGYQRNRILAVLFKEQYEGVLFQQLRAQTAMGSGKLTGIGFFNPSHYYVPLSENDFIFSYITECAGFLGASAVILILLYITARLISIAKTANNDCASYIVSGVFALIAVQSVLNIGMNLMLLPVIGITLPLFSAGGSSQLCVFLALGLALSVKRHNRENLY